MTIGAFGQPLPLPSRLFPTRSGPAPASPDIVGTNRFSLSAGEAARIPAGPYWIQPGKFSFAQVRDPVSNTWRTINSDNQNPLVINSDGTNFRIANLTGCLVAVRVTGGGAGYNRDTDVPTVTVSSGGATARAVVGGAIGTVRLLVNSGSVTSGAGDSYTLVPMVMIDMPTSGGVQATAVAQISGDQIVGYAISNQGAGYITAPRVRVVAHPDDPNIGTIIDATADTVLTGATSVTAIRVTWNGIPQAGPPTLTVASPVGGGTVATAAPIMCFTTVALNVTATEEGSNYRTPVAVMSIGGDTSGGAFTQPAFTNDVFQPRQALWQAGLSSGGLSATGARAIDAGLFQVTPASLPVGNKLIGFNVGETGTTTFTMGSATDTVYVTPLGGTA